MSLRCGGFRNAGKCFYFSHTRPLGRQPFDFDLYIMRRTNAQPPAGNLPVPPEQLIMDDRNFRYLPSAPALSALCSATRVRSYRAEIGLRVTQTLSTGLWAPRSAVVNKRAVEWDGVRCSDRDSLRASTVFSNTKKPATLVIFVCEQRSGNFQISRHRVTHRNAP